jgi:hypothetical protein
MLCKYSAHFTYLHTYILNGYTNYLFTLYIYIYLFIYRLMTVSDGITLNIRITGA